MQRHLGKRASDFLKIEGVAPVSFVSAIFDQLIATATITFSKENSVATMRKRLLSEGSYYGLVWK